MGGLFGPYDMDTVPIEGVVGEDRSPLILKKFEPGPNQSYEEAAYGSKKEEGEDASPVEEVDTSQRISRIRGNTTKCYNVLSVEEAELINRYVSRMFSMKLALLAAVSFSALVILSIARSEYGNLRDDVLALVQKS